MTQDSMTNDDIALSAYLDGELPQEQADRLTERLAAEPDLARRLEAMRGGDEAARALFAKLDELPLPKAVLDLLESPASATGNVVPFPARAIKPFLQLPVAIAASVALLAGFLVHDLLRNAATTGSTVDGLVAGDVAQGSELYRLLETGLSTEPQTLAGGSRGQLLLTFEDVAGDYCRQFQVATVDRTMQAVACRRAGDWRLEIADFEPLGAPGGQYQQASQAGAAVNAAVDALIGGREPLDAGAESRLVHEGWKK